LRKRFDHDFYFETLSSGLFYTFQRDGKFFYNFLSNSSSSDGKHSGLRDAQQDQGSLLSNFFQTLGMTFGLSGDSLSWPRPNRKSANASESEDTVKTGPVIWPTCISKKRCLSHEFTGRSE
jgi:hypothetical protein